MRKCPICGRNFDEKSSESLPFCSKRCKTIDLKRWLNEEYSFLKDKDEEEETAEGWEIDENN